MLQRLRRRQQANGSKAASNAKIGSTATTAAPRKIHSIHALLKERKFNGEFEARNAKYNFDFIPTAAAINKNNQLELTGRFTVKPERGSERAVEGLRAVLLATQGGIGGSLTRRQLATGTAETSNTSSTDQKQEEGKSPELSQQPVDSARQAKLPGDAQQTPGTPRTARTGITSTQSTDEDSFVGVMYFRLSSIDGRALGVPVDMSQVQLNLRLNPEDEKARDMQFLFSDLVLAMDGERKNERTTNQYVQEINKALKA